MCFDKWISSRKVYVFESLFLTVNLIVNVFAFSLESLCLGTSSLSSLWNNFGTLFVHNVQELIIMMDMGTKQGAI